MGVGVYFSRRQTNLDQYFLTRQSMTWLTVGLSLMASLDSAIDYLLQPSATTEYGSTLQFCTVSWLLVYQRIAIVTRPFNRRLNYFTTYYYILSLFNVSIRTLTTRLFIVWRLVSFSTAI